MNVGNSTSHVGGSLFRGRSKRWFNSHICYGFHQFLQTCWYNTLKEVMFTFFHIVTISSFIHSFTMPWESIFNPSKTKISQLWGSSLLLHNHCSSSYTQLPTDANCCTFSYPHCPGHDKTGSNKHVYKERDRERESTILLCRCHYNQCTVLSRRKWKLKRHSINPASPLQKPVY